jgi:SAM-dependent methyltransferase
MNSGSDKYPHGITLKDVAAMLARDVETVKRALTSDALVGLDYRWLSDEESEAVRGQVVAAVADPELNPAGINALSHWETTWHDILERVEREGLNDSTLVPQYFRHTVLRLGGRYIKSSSPDFQPRLYHAFKTVIFDEYLPGVAHALEIGCGTGLNLIQLRQKFPKMRLTGCDWAGPSQKLVRLLDSVRGVRFDMRTLDGCGDVLIDAETAVLTLQAMEQLGPNFNALFRWLLERAPQIVIHVEPIMELYDEADTFDALAIDYHRKRGYLEGFLPALDARAATGDIEILETRRTGFGSTFTEAYTIIVWRPK